MTQGALRDRMLAAQIEYGSPATERIQQIVIDPARRSADFNTVATGLVEQFKGVDDTISKSNIARPPSSCDAERQNQFLLLQPNSSKILLKAPCLVGVSGMAKNFSG